MLLCGSATLVLAKQPFEDLQALPISAGSLCSETYQLTI